MIIIQRIESASAKQKKTRKNTNKEMSPSLKKLKFSTNKPRAWEYLLCEHQKRSTTSLSPNTTRRIGTGYGSAWKPM